MGKTRCVLWLTGLLMLSSVAMPGLGTGQEKPPIELPEVVIIGQEERIIQEEKDPIRPHTIPIGLKGEVEAGKIARLAPPTTEGGFAGPAAENSGCLLFPRVQGAQDERDEPPRDDPGFDELAVEPAPGVSCETRASGAPEVSELDDLDGRIRFAQRVTQRAEIDWLLGSERRSQRARPGWSDENNGEPTQSRSPR